jgi:hypothetical protein
MADSAVFEWACETLERASGLSRLQARGTIRLLLGQAGLESKSFKASQLRVVAARLLAKELRARGLTNVEEICELLSTCPPHVDQAATETGSEDPEEIFKRLGRRD